MPDFSREDLSGPKVDRRTAMQLFGAAGFSATLAGCTGDDPDLDGDGTGNGTDDDTAPTEDELGGSIEAGWLMDQIQNLDPHFVNRGEQMAIHHNIHAALVRLDAEGNIVGELAEDWELLDDTTYQFDLHEGVTFHNGDPLDAEAVQWSMNRLRDTEESPHFGKVESITNIDTPDETTVVIELEEPLSPFLAFMTNAPGRAGTIVNRTALEEMGDDDYNFMPVGAGPFELVDRTPGESLTLEAYDDYFETDEEGNQLPYLDEIEINLIPESSTIWSAFETQEIEFAQALPAEQANQAEGRPDIQVEGTDQGYRAVSFLAKDPQEEPEWAVVAGNPDSVDEVTDAWEGEEIPTADPRVRRALSKAIDREELVERALMGWGIPAHSLWQPSVAMAYEEEPDPGQYYDPEAARELLDEAGYTGDPRFEVEMLTRPGNDERVCTVIQDMWADVGVEITLNVQQPAGYWDTFYNYESMVALTSSATMIDPWMAWFRQLTTPTGEGNMGVWQKGLWSNEEFDELLLESRATPDPDERMEVVREAEEIFMEEAPYAMTHFPLRPVGSHEDLSGVQLPVGLTNFHYARLE